MLQNEDTFTHNGRTYLVYIEGDDDDTPPWEREEGHGVVTDWVTRDEYPGEWILARGRARRRYYDSKASRQIALRDGWGLIYEDMQRLTHQLGREPTPDDIADEAVRLDYEFLRGWCAGEWYYVGVFVALVGEDGEDLTNRYDAALWGIESNAHAYIEEVAHELAEQIEPPAEPPVSYHTARTAWPWPDHNAEAPISNCWRYAQALDDLALTPNGDDFNALLEFLNGHPYREPSKEGR